MHLRFQLRSVRIHNQRRTLLHLVHLLIQFLQLGDQVILKMLAFSFTGLGKFLTGFAKGAFQYCPKLFLVYRLLLHSQNIRITGKSPCLHVILNAKLLCHLADIGHVLRCKLFIIFQCATA